METDIILPLEVWDYIIRLEHIKYTHPLYLISKGFTKLIEKKFEYLSKWLFYDREEKWGNGFINLRLENKLITMCYMGSYQVEINDIYSPIRLICKRDQKSSEKVLCNSMLLRNTKTGKYIDIEYSRDKHADRLLYVKIKHNFGKDQVERNLRPKIKYLVSSKTIEYMTLDITIQYNNLNMKYLLGSLYSDLL